MTCNAIGILRRVCTHHLSYVMLRSILLELTDHVPTATIVAFVSRSLPIHSSQVAQRCSPDQPLSARDYRRNIPASHRMSSHRSVFTRAMVKHISRRQSDRCTRESLSPLAISRSRHVVVLVKHNRRSVLAFPLLQVLPPRLSFRHAPSPPGW